MFVIIGKVWSERTTAEGKVNSIIVMPYCMKIGGRRDTVKPV